MFRVEIGDPASDARELRRAMKGLGTDEKTLIRIFSSRSKEQLQIIAQQYSALFGRNLEHDVSSETSGNFRKLLIGLSMCSLVRSLTFSVILFGGIHFIFTKTLFKNGSSL
jgi:hypothetical protein